MRFLFLDEAGVSADEPVAVVVAVIVHADQQAAPADLRAETIYSQAPLAFRKKHPVFHAKSIWGEREFRNEWSLEQRKKLLIDMMSCPRELNLSVAFGAAHRDLEIPDEIYGDAITKVQVRHGVALQQCLWAADRWMMKFCGPNEIATVIAEDVPESKGFLKYLVSHMRNDQAFIQLVESGVFDHVVPREINLSNERTLHRIRTPIHFCSKIEEPLLQIADSCAFGLRRYLAGYPHGDDFMTAIGADVKIDRWEQRSPKHAVMGTVFTRMLRPII